MLKGQITCFYEYEAIKVIGMWHILGISQVNVKLIHRKHNVVNN